MKGSTVHNEAASRQEQLQRAIGERIREFRSSKGWSQERLGDLCRIHRSHMGQIENGATNPELSTLRKIADALDIPIASLFS